MQKMMSGSGNGCFDGREAPDPEEIDVDLYGKGIPESATLLPSEFIFTRIHFISKRDLLLIIRRKEPNLCAQ